MIVQSFLTGSRVYGNPKKCVDSDLDLVLFLEENEKDALLFFADHWGNKGGSGNSWSNSLRFDMLNIIVVSNKRDYDVWKEGTERLKVMAPVTKEQAIAMFTKLGLPQKDSPTKQCSCDGHQLLFGGCICGGI